MSSILYRAIRNSTARVLFLIFICILSLVAYFIISSYNKQLKAYQTGELERLYGIASTLSILLDGDKHQQLMQKYPLQNAISSSEQDSIYNQIHRTFTQTVQANNLKMDAIYTLVYDTVNKSFCFGIMSGNPYWRYPWTDFNVLHIENYSRGAVIPHYVDANGTWLSAFVPLKNSAGQQVGIIQVDQEFDSYISIVKKQIYSWVIISFIVVFIIVLFLSYSIRDLLIKEQKHTDDLELALNKIRRSNREIIESLEYARRIQDAILPSKKMLAQYFGNSFVFYQPLDIVSGDFFWMAKNEDRVFIAAVDCTGHGVPGALMSIIGSTFLSEIVKDSAIKKPSSILDHLEARVNSAMHAHDIGARDGMDIGLVSICLKTLKIDFAGALRPLVVAKNSGITEIRADRFPIGGGFDIPKHHFNNHSLQLNSGDSLYLFTDGYIDQIGGERNKRIGTKRLRAELNHLNHLKIQERQEHIESFWKTWKGEGAQIDDVLLIGIQLA